MQTIFLIALPFLILDMFCSTGYAADGLVWERFRLLPALSVSESYSDNIYFDPSGARGDMITMVSPKASLDFALAPQHFLSARYNGDFRSYERSDNFKKYVHQTGLSWSLTAPLGSTFKADAGEKHDSVQPYSATDTYKEYVERETSADVVLKSMLFADLGIKYDHLSRRFADSLYEPDDFSTDSGTINLTYWALPSTGFLAEYSYARQRNYNLSNARTMDTQIVLAGATWNPTAKLSGHLKAGYYYTRLEGDANSGGFDMDTDLSYTMSDFTKLRIAAFRKVVRSTLVDRETGEFYISTGGNLSASYGRWSPITMTMDVSYRNNRFSQTDTLPGGMRIDNLFSTGLGAGYSLNDRLTVSMNYTYKVNGSNYSAYWYHENRVEARLSLAI